MFSRPERLIIALMVALFFAGITLIAADAAPQFDGGEVQCANCHSALMQEWQNGPHGQATIDPVFNEAWQEQGTPTACLMCHTTGYDAESGTWEHDGIACEACHGEIPADHPENPMQIDRSPVLCGTCHSDVRFGWENWEESSHYQRDMTCINCHNPHQATLKTLPAAESGETDQASALCRNCHSEYSQTSTHTIHGQNDVSCSDCHVNMDTVTPAHTVQDHSFMATLEACTSCHENEIHNAEEVATTPEEHEIQFSGVAVSPQPGAVSPIGYAGLAGLIGLAAGAVLAPWLECKYKNICGEKESKDHE